MALKFAGDFERLNDFALRLETAGDDGFLRNVNRQLAEEAVELVREGFELSRDPNGKPWDPLVLRIGRPLEDKGGLKASWHVQFADADEFGIASAKEYAIHHQRGTGIHGPRGKPIVPIRARALFIPGVGPRSSVDGAPARKMVPDDGRIPRAWRERFVDVAHEVLTELFRGK